ncbi:sigma-54-dependent Fis family transcriptional regulator [Thioalkalivibrio denitrificans]|uniref:Sigma-54-dependent Fis family transcriptional regulator n=1 Tax=Thioalkalivibrio denitrificans TaxID=108003 RepID=A0A1V3N6Q0_9GAMM|nr:sigma-54 dependent transcriptional regulator [Thioalkalivibrio denitrificans]OOG20653.1 sigma-54-dependent Fis family transcriptional regulator [Thioalkalivibrio denitrificans]
MHDPANILFVDDDPRAGELFLRFCEGGPNQVRVFRDPAEALAHFKAEGADLIITDLAMPNMSGMELLSAVRAHDPDVPVIIITGYSTVDSAIEALRLGATDFIKKPYDTDELLVLIERTLEGVRLRRENRLLRRQLKDERLRYGMVGRGEAMEGIYRVIDKVADIRCNVIIEGESGTGKELVARAIHNQGPDAEKPFVVIDCGALNETLLESELFGHEKGAFTGASHTKAGLLESASGGTVFLDEICNVSDAMQVKLLRVVQEQQVVRVGSVRPIAIDVRFIAATNRNLEAMVEAGEFRHDLYHRLNVVKIVMPPLRARREDIPVLLQAFVEEFAGRYHRQVDGFDAQSLERLQAYDWPGNVRELRNLVERHIALADGPQLHLDPQWPGAVDAQGTTPALDADEPDLATLERRYILKTLERLGGNREQTARALGINKSTLWRKLQQYEQAE